MPLRLALAVRETGAGHRLGALEGGWGMAPPPSNASLLESVGELSEGDVGSEGTTEDSARSTDVGQAWAVAEARCSGT